jgi:hypothetical protein
MKIKLPNKDETKKGYPIYFPVKKRFITLFILCLFYSGIQAQITTGFELDGNAISVLPNPPEDWIKYSTIQAVHRSLPM